MQERRYQKGLTAISWAVLIAVLSFFAMLFLKLFPLYMENFGVASSLKSLQNEDRSMDIIEIRDLLSKRLDINDVENVKTKNISIIRKGSSYTVEVDYEVRVPFAFNVDLVVSFNNEAEVPAN